MSLESDAAFRALVELSPDAVFVISDGYHVFANSRGLALLGATTLTELRARPALEFMHPDYRALGAARLGRMTDEREPLDYVEEKVVRLDGSVVEIEAAGTPIDVAGRPAALVVVRDITARRRSERAARIAELRWQAAFSRATTPLVICDADGIILAANPAFADLLGQDVPSVVNAACWNYVAPPDLPYLRAQWSRLTAFATDAIEGELRCQRADGETRLVYARAAPLGDDAAFVIHLTDVTHERRTRARLVRRAHHDSLTGLVNRYVVLDRLTAESTRDDGSAAVLFLDLDGLKLINDSYGHRIGDAILTAVGQRLGRAVPGTDIVGRIGGDEFAVVLRGDNSPMRAPAVAEKIAEALAEPVPTAAGPVTVSASIGMATTYDISQTSAMALLDEADSGMYDAKIKAQSGSAHGQAALQHRGFDVPARDDRDRASAGQ